MILLVVFGGLIFVLGCFYLVNSWQQYHQWKFATLLVLVSLAVTVYGVINLPYWHKNSSAQTSSQTSAKSSSSGTSSNSISGYSNNTALSSSTANMTQEQKEAALLKQLQSSYSKFGSVAFQIDPSSGDEADSLKYLAQNPSQASSMGWSSLTDSLDKTSTQVSKLLGSDYSISLMNPNDTSQAMYTTKNGSKTYDIADQ